MRTKTPRGFTLVELLVVIVIIAIISASVVALMSGLTTQSAVSMTYATEKQLTDEFNVYNKANRGILPNGYDSLMRDDYATTGTGAFTTDPTTGQIYLTSPASTSGFISVGKDTDQNSVTDPGASFKGLTVMLMGPGVQTLTVAHLRDSDLKALNSLGITYVYDIDHTADAADSSKLTYIKRTLQVGDPVMALDSNKAYGTMPTYVTMNGSANTTTNKVGTVEAGTPLVKELYLVFGIGPKCTIVGNRVGGLQEAPICPTIVTTTSDKPKPRTDYYNYYMAVIKMPYDTYDKPSFAGILDSQGWNTQGGIQWYTRFPE